MRGGCFLLRRLCEEGGREKGGREGGREGRKRERNEPLLATARKSIK